MPSEDFDAADLRVKLLSDTDVLDDIVKQPEPEIRPAPETARGFRFRFDLQDTKPPVWRRLEVPGDVTLSSLHDVLQTTMGWTDSHLHRFRTGAKCQGWPSCPGPGLERVLQVWPDRPCGVREIMNELSQKLDERTT